MQHSCPQEPQVTERISLLFFLIVWPKDSITYNCSGLFCLFHILLLFSGTSRWHSQFYSITRVSATLLSSGFDDFMRIWWRSEVDVAQSLTEIESSVDITRLSKASKRVLKVNNCWNFSARTCHCTCHCTDLGGIMWGEETLYSCRVRLALCSLTQKISCFPM